MTYQEKLKDPRWQKKRLEILQRDGFKCVWCGDERSTLHIHHLRYSEKDPWSEPNENLKSICLHCHSLATFYEGEGFEILKLEKSFRRNGQILYYCLHEEKGEPRIYMVTVEPDGSDITVIAAMSKMDLSVLSDLFNYKNG